MGATKVATTVHALHQLWTGLYSGTEYGKNTGVSALPSNSQACNHLELELPCQSNGTGTRTRVQDVRYGTTLRVKSSLDFVPWYLAHLLPVLACGMTTLTSLNPGVEEAESG